MITRLLLAMLFLLVAAPFTAAQSTIGSRIADQFDAPLPLLRPHVVVRSDLVTLGDLFDHAGMYAETPVFRAPAPGTRGMVAVHDVLHAARQAGLERVDLAGLNDVAVERAGIRLFAQDFENLAEQALMAELEAAYGGDAGHYAITLSQAPAPMTIGAELAGQLSVNLLIAPSGRSEHFAASVRTPAGEEIARLEGRAQHRVQIPVLGRPISRGDIISASDLRLQDVAYSRTLGTPTLTETADIVGQAAARSLRAGLPLNPDDLAEPLLVERQELVTLVYRQGALALTVRARAIDDGARGQSIDVMNLQSNRIVRGIVAGNGLVHVLGPMQDIAATLPLSSSDTAERIQ